MSDKTVKVKISGDGARMTRLTNYVILSYCILTETEDTLSAKGNIILTSVNVSNKHYFLWKRLNCVNKKVFIGTILLISFLLENTHKLRPVLVISALE